MTLDIERTLKTEFYQLKQVERNILERLNTETNQANIDTLTDGLNFTRENLDKCIEDMRYFGVKVGAGK